MTKLKYSTSTYHPQQSHVSSEKQNAKLKEMVDYATEKWTQIKIAINERLTGEHGCCTIAAVGKSAKSGFYCMNGGGTAVHRTYRFG